MSAALKWLGAFFIIFSGLGIGIGGAAELRRRVKTLSDFIATFVTIRAEITIRAATIPEIMENLGRSSPHTVRPFYARVGENMHLIGERSFADIWRRNIGRSGELGLKEEELAEIIALGASLGRYDAKEQESAINLCISRLNALLEVAREEARTGGKLAMGLGIAGGSYSWLYLYDKRELYMEVDLIFKIAAVGILVAVLNILLSRSGREEQALMTTIAGLIVVLVIIVQEISDLFNLIKSLFGF